MKELILIKYAELTTKKDNRNLFINTLYNNIYEKLKNSDVKITKEHSKMFVEFDSKAKDKVVDVLNHTFGIHSYCFCYKVKTDVLEIKEKVLSLLQDKDYKTFKVETKRCDKTFPIKSMDFNNIIGGYILKNIDGIKVDVHNPFVYVNIEINKENTYIYLDTIKGLGGYPVSVGGKGLVMLSGGIDSPVAFYLTLKRGIKLDAIYFEAIPHTSLNAREKVINLSKKLHNYCSSFNLYVASITKLQETIYKTCDKEYVITILRRMMYRVAEKTCKKYNCKVIVNGESIGQVASQTLDSMAVINEVVKTPVVRPVACFDKLEIIDIAKKIDTYDISILPYEDCCTIFVPKHPVINPKLEKCLEMEKKFDYETLIDEVVDNIKIIKITDEKEFNDML